MNERIKELADNATHYANGVCDVDTTADWYETRDQKFAELIVRECVNICLDRHDTWRWDNDADSDSGPRDCARSIKEHFGVEE